MGPTQHRQHLVDTKDLGAIVIADDHPLFRHALVTRVVADYPSATVLEADTLESMHALLARHDQIDLVLLDLNMPGSHGLSALIHVRAMSPGLSVVVVSAHEEPSTMRRALQLGAAGFIPKSSSLGNISNALRTVLEGSRYVPDVLRDCPNLPALSANEQSTARRIGALTPQQFRIASLLAAGMLNKQIAWNLSITEATVKVHMKSIMQKLDARNRTQVALQMQTFDESARVEPS